MSYENNLIETLVSVFTVENGNLKVLLLRKKTEPYKGYWIIFSRKLSYSNDSLDYKKSIT